MPISWLMGRNARGSGGKTIISPIPTEWQTPSGQTLQSRAIISTYVGKGKTVSTFPITNEPYAVQVKVTPTGSSQPVMVPIGPGTTTSPGSSTISSSSGGAPGGTETGGYPSGMPEAYMPSTGGKLPSWVEPVAILGGLAALGLGIYAVSRKKKSKRRR